MEASVWKHPHLKLKALAYNFPTSTFTSAVGHFYPPRKQDGVLLRRDVIFSYR